MFGKIQYTVEKKRRAALKLEKAKEQLRLAGEIMGIERETKYVKKQIGLMEEADKKITAAQFSLMGRANKLLIGSQIQGMKDQVGKSLPAMLESRQVAGGQSMHSSLKYLQSVKERAKV